MDFQKRYWQELVQLKFELCYLDEYKGRTEKVNQTIQMFTAITSSASIGGWALWNSISYIWATIIAASQVLAAIKTYLPYNRRSKAINDTYNQLSLLFIKAEHGWFQVSDGSMTTREINDKQFELKKEKQLVYNKTFASQSLPTNSRIRARADQTTERYFANFYS